MKNRMKQLNRVLLVILAAVCLAVCLRIEVNAVTYYDETCSNKTGYWVKAADNVRWCFKTNAGDWVYSAWIKDSSGNYYYIDSAGYMVTSKWVSDGGLYYMESDGKMAKNTFVPANNTTSSRNLYVGGDGLRVANKWIQYGGYTYWIGEDSIYDTGWVKVSGVSYYLGTDGKRVTGWSTQNGVTYYLNPSSSPAGAMVTGWKTISGKDYYFNSSGIMQKNTTVDGYYLGSDGAKYTGWLNNAYYKNGKVLTGWQTISGSVYYLNSSGVRVTGTQTIDGKYYYFASDGKQQTNGWKADNRYYRSGSGSAASAYVSTTTPDGYYVGSNGLKYTGWVDTKYYSGGKILTGWQTISGSVYYLNSSGVRVTGTQTIDSKYYYFASDGKQQTNGWKADNRYYRSGSGSAAYAYVNAWTPDGYWVGSDGLKKTNTWDSSNKYWSNGSAQKAVNAWVDSNKYYVGSDGLKVTGTQTIGGKYYYFGTNGLQQTNGWKADGRYYRSGSGSAAYAYVSEWTPDDTYVGSDGKVYTGYAAQNSVDYYVVSGKKANGTYNDGTGTFYFKGGLKYTGWEGNSYYLEGVKQTGWQKIGNYWYYLGTDGVMWSGGWKEIGGAYYYLNADGILLQGDDKGWLQIGSDWYMLKTTGATTPAEGLYSRMNGWITIDSTEYYLDPENGDIMAADEWVPSTNDATDHTAYVDADGARVYDDWVDDYNYYIDDTGIMHIGWKEYEDKWYHFGSTGHKDTGWSEQDGVWYYLDPESSPITGAMVTGLKEIEGNKYYFYEEGSGYTEGSMATNTFVLDGTYYATDNGILIPPDEFHYTLNPYFDYVPGGLYGIPSDPAEQIPVTETYKDNVNQDIPAEYAQLSIGAHPAVSIDPETLDTVTRAETGWDAAGQWVWDYAEDQVVDASVENRSAINGNMYALYHSVATWNGAAVDLKITVVDYSVVAGEGQTPVIAFNRQDKIPGVMGLNLSWVQLKYELLDAETGELLDPDTTMGNTTYYDIDAFQSVCFNDSTNQGIYSRDICELYTGTVTGHGVLDGPCVFLNNSGEYNEEEHMYQGGVTEIFKGSTLIRTFSFKNGTTSQNYVYTPEYYMGAASGIILNDGQPVANGALHISNTVSPDNGVSYEYTITLTNAGELDAVFGGVEFEDGVATVYLKHGESVTISGIPSGLSYSVAQKTTADGYVTRYTGETGTIVKDSTAYAVFKNVKLVDLTVTKTVEGEFAPVGKEFVITVHYIEPGDKPEDEKTVPLIMRNGDSLTISIPYGSYYYVTEDYSAEGYSTVGTFPAEQKKTLTDSDTVNIVNTLRTGILTVEKIVDATGDALNRQFEFTLTVYYAKASGEEQATEFLTETFTLGNGGKKEFTLPLKATYTVTETPVEGFTTEMTDTGNGVLENEATVTFTNTRLPMLTIGNTVIGNSSALDQSFTYTVEVVPPGGDQENPDVHTVTLSNNETVTLPLPSGCKYTVTLTDPTEGYLTTVTSGSASSENMDGDKEVHFRHVQLIDVTLTKKVTGNNADRSLAFDFAVTFTAEENQVQAHSITNDDNVAIKWADSNYSLSLMDGQSVTFKVPYGTGYTVTEAETDYTVKITVTDENANTEGRAASGTAEVHVEITYTNSKFFPVPTGLRHTVLPFVIMLLAGLGLGAQQLLAGSEKRRRR